MKKRAILAEIIIWIIILALFFSALAFAYFKIFVEPNVYTVQFEDIDGITKGSPVRLMGLNIGYVRKLKPARKHVEVQILVTNKNTKIPNGTIARVEFYGLGGSKSIELMPPDGSCDVGILTGETIRLNDVVHELDSVVEIIEMFEKYTKNFNKTGTKKILESIQTAKDYKNAANNDRMDNFETDMSKKLDEIRAKQKIIDKKIKRMNENTEKINKFIKK